MKISVVVVAVSMMAMMIVMVSVGYQVDGPDVKRTVTGGAGGHLAAESPNILLK